MKQNSQLRKGKKQLLKDKKYRRLNNAKTDNINAIRHEINWEDIICLETYQKVILKLKFNQNFIESYHTLKNRGKYMNIIEILQIS